MTHLKDTLHELFYVPEESWETVDHLIYGLDDYHAYHPEKIAEMRLRAIREAFAHHYENNLFYQKLCKERDVTPADIKTEDDLHKIPLIPDTFFKNYPSEEPQQLYEWLYAVSSVDIGEFDFSGKKIQDFLRWAETRLNGVVNHSSGTTGKFSFMFRDELTSKRMFFAADKTLLFSIVPPRDDAHFIYPGPTRTHLTIGRWIAEGTRIFPGDRRHFLTDRELSIDILRIMSGHVSGVGDRFKLMVIKKAMEKGQLRLINMLKEMDKKGQQVYMLSFPYQIYDLMKKMEEAGVYLNLGESDSVILTGGGWKIYEDRKVSVDEFAKRVEEFFGVPQDHYRDLYGMSEMNGIALDCRHRHKHLSPWIYPMVLDEENNPLPFGEVGRFAFLDPAAHSYPGFMMTGDQVKILEECPSCSLQGMVIRGDISRMAGAEAKGCGNLMREIMVKEMR
jgi:long-chain-fatty-acid---luciferin-component ligase